ncbi:MAG: hypothetical protein CMK92_04515 [Pseudomonas sp.]|nr:hypothetical protein [Pseudomonas sp.]|tara:strand:- start:1476 stop:2186 length:711 start_codon:yes stop_codon:yes gene_type:complete
MPKIVVGGSTFPADSKKSPDQFKNGIVPYVASLWRIEEGNVDCKTLTKGIPQGRMSSMRKSETFMHISASMGIMAHFDKVMHVLFSDIVQRIEGDLNDDVMTAAASSTKASVDTSSEKIYKYTRRDGANPEFYYVGFCPFKPVTRTIRLLMAFEGDSVISRENRAFLNKTWLAMKKASEIMQSKVKTLANDEIGFQSCKEFHDCIVSVEGIACGESIELAIRDCTNILIKLINRTD